MSELRPPTPSPQIRGGAFPPFRRREREGVPFSGPLPCPPSPGQRPSGQFPIAYSPGQALRFLSRARSPPPRKLSFSGSPAHRPGWERPLGKLAALLPAAGWCCGRCAGVCARGRVGKGGSQRHAQAATSRQEKESGSFKCVSERRSAGQRATAGEASAVGARLSYLLGSEFSGKQRHRVCCGRPEDSIGVSIGDKGGEEVFGRAGKGKAGAPGPTSQGITARSCTPKPCGI